MSKIRNKKHHRNIRQGVPQSKLGNFYRLLYRQRKQFIAKLDAKFNAKLEKFLAHQDSCNKARKMVTIFCGHC